MKKACKILLVAVLLTILSVFPVSASDGWKKAIDDKGIRIFTRPISGFPMDEFKAECTLDAPIEVVYEIMKDGRRYPEWFANCSFHKVLRSIDDHNRIAYHVVDIPFPFSDRDTFVNLKFNTDWDVGRVILDISSIEEKENVSYDIGAFSRYKNHLKMKKMKSIVIATRITSEKTNVVYQGYADAGIPLPGSMLNAITANQPYNTFKGLRRELKNHIYYKRAEKRHNRTFPSNL